MRVNFEKIEELAFIVSLGETIMIEGGFIVNEYTFGEFISNFFDA